MDSLRRDLYDQSNTKRFTDYVIISITNKEKFFVHKCVICREELGFHNNNGDDTVEVNLSRNSIELFIKYMYLNTIVDTNYESITYIELLNWILGCNVGSTLIKMLLDKILVTVLLTQEEDKITTYNSFISLLKVHSWRLPTYMSQFISCLTYLNPTVDDNLSLEIEFAEGDEYIAELGNKILTWVCVSKNDDEQKLKILMKYEKLNPTFKGVDLYNFSITLNRYPNLLVIRYLLSIGVKVPYNPSDKVSLSIPSFHVINNRLDPKEFPEINSKHINIINDAVKSKTGEKEDRIIENIPDKKEDYSDMPPLEATEKIEFLNKDMREEFIMSGTLPRAYFKTIDKNREEDNLFVEISKYGEVTEVTRTYNGFNVLFSDIEEMRRVVSILEQ